VHGQVLNRSAVAERRQWRVGSLQGPGAYRAGCRRRTGTDTFTTGGAGRWVNIGLDAWSGWPVRFETVVARATGDTDEVGCCRGGVAQPPLSVFNYCLALLIPARRSTSALTPVSRHAAYEIPLRLP
jgi:hypothetical protein